MSTVKVTQAAEVSARAGYISAAVPAESRPAKMHAAIAAACIDVNPPKDKCESKKQAAPGKELCAGGFECAPGEV